MGAPEHYIFFTSADVKRYNRCEKLSRYKNAFSKCGNFRGSIVKRVKMRHRVKFRGDRSNRC